MPWGCLIQAFLLTEQKNDDNCVPYQPSILKYNNEIGSSLYYSIERAEFCLTCTILPSSYITLQI